MWHWTAFVDDKPTGAVESLCTWTYISVQLNVQSYTPGGASAPELIHDRSDHTQTNTSLPPNGSSIGSAVLQCSRPWPTDWQTQSNRPGYSFLFNNKSKRAHRPLPCVTIGRHFRPNARRSISVPYNRIVLFEHMERNFYSNDRRHLGAENQRPENDG